MKIIPSKAYGNEFGPVFSDIGAMGLEQRGFEHFGDFHKSRGEPRTVKDIVRDEVKGKDFSLVLYQAKTRKLGEYRIVIYGR